MPKRHHKSPPAPQEEEQPLPPTQHTREPLGARQRAAASLVGVQNFFEGYDDCIIGTAVHITAPDRAGVLIAVYSSELLLDKLRLTMTDDVAAATLKGNLEAQWFGAATPLIVWPLE